MAGLTESIARFVADTNASDFPPRAMEKAKIVVADSFACIVAGAGSETAEPLARYVERQVREATSACWARGCAPPRRLRRWSTAPSATASTSTTC